MTITYTEVKSPLSDTTSIQRTNEDGSVSLIPQDPANSDYQAYLAYVANGNKVPSESSIPTTPQAGA